MAIPFNTFLNVLVSKLDSNKPEIRKYMNLKPHAMSLDSEYLAALGLSKAEIADVHKLAKNKAKANKGRIAGIDGWTESNETVLLVGGNNLDRAKGITARINSYLKGEKVETKSVSSSIPDIEKSYSNQLNSFTKAVDRALSNHGIKIATSLETLTSSKGSQSQLIIGVTPLAVGVSKELDKEIEESILAYIGKDALAVTGTLEDIDNALTNTFLNKQTGIKRRSKSSFKTVKGKKKKATKTLLPPLVKSSVLDLFKLQTLINAKLHNTIRDNMAEPNAPISKDKKYLRYRSGRFAGSAKVNSLTQTRSGILASKYSYMNYQYDTFLPPKGVQSSVERSPRRYIAKSIRQILVEQLGKNIRVRSTNV